MSTADRTYDIGLIVGSNRRESINRRLANAMVEIAPPAFSIREIAIDALPFYNGDLEADRPTPVVEFTTQVRATDGVLIVTPEYNRSLPALLKNAIDWGSKPMDRNVWAGKAIATCGTSPGAIATAAAQLHLRQVLGVLGAQVVGGEAYIQWKPDLLDADGAIATESTRSFLGAFLQRFERLVRQTS